MSYRQTELITWSDTFSCGIKLIDDQHKELVRLVNEMYNHVSRDEEQDREYFNKIIREVVTYIKIHFSTEEKIMVAAEFSGYAEHKKIHDGFILSVTDKIGDLSAGKRLSLFSFTRFLKNWALSHIAVTDKEHFEFLRKNTCIKDDGKTGINLSPAHIIAHADVSRGMREIA